MWSSSRRTEDDTAIASPEPARSHDPFRSHEEPDSMGDDSYLRRRTSVPTRSGSRKGAGLNRAGTQRSAGSSSDGLSSSDQSSQNHEGAIAAGMPIGFLAALGTPYAKKPIWRSRKCKILCPILGLVTAIVAILLGIFPIVRAIAVHTLNVSVLQVTSSNITQATNTSFRLTLEGQAKKVGIFPARIFFERPVDVYWIAPEDLNTELHLGQFPLEPIGVANGHGRIKQLTEFQILDVAGFARFTEFLITQEQFTWRLKSQSVQAKAFGFIAANNLNFVKDLTLPGMANMTDVYISDFQLPGNDPQGGISLAVQTQFTNPSAFGVELGTLAVDLYYQNLYLGPAETASPINLTAGVNTVNLRGRLIPYTDNRAALEQLSVVFSNYLNGKSTPVQAAGRSVTLPDGRVISWLSAGIQALVLNVPLSSPTGPIAPIKAISIEALSLSYTPETAYMPIANSSSTTAQIALPFGFSLDISQLTNSIAIVENQTQIAVLQPPPGTSETRLTAQNSGFTTGIVDINLPASPLQVGSSYVDHLIFDQFQYDLTTTNGSRFFLVGNASAVTSTPIGQVFLRDISFTVPSGLVGLESLLQYPTTILSVDVLGGTTEAIILAINVGLTNPSNLDLTVGNVTFQLFNDDAFLGTTVLPDLHLTSGYQEHVAIGYFQANNNPMSLRTLNDFVSGRNNQLAISGFNGSTAVESLTQAFMAIHLNATLTGLQVELLEYANLTVLDTTGRVNNDAQAIVALNNPFTTGLTITDIQSNVTAYGLFVGSIVQQTQFPASGRAVSISPDLTFGLNLYPPDIFALLRVLVVQGGQDPTPLDIIVGIGGYQYTPTTATAAGRMRKRSTESILFERQMYPRRSTLESFNAPIRAALSDPAGEIEEYEEMDLLRLQKRQSPTSYDFSNFDLPSYVLQAFAGLRVNVDLISAVSIGQYPTDLTYSQTGVPAYTDQTLTLLLPVLALPIVQKIVDGAILGIDTVTITNPQNTAFTAGLVGSLTNAGPFNAVVSFPQGLTVAWNGRPLGQIAMPDISLVGNVGATLNLQAAFNVADVGYLTEFTTYLLTEPSFTWQIYGEELSVAAIGITVPGINILKTVVLDGFNGLKGLVRVDAFDLPANDPAGGVSLTLQTTIQNPSSVGVELSTIGFQNFFGSTNIGPASSTSSFTLTPKSTINLPLAGRLIPQTTEQGLQDVSTIFNGYIHGVPVDLVVAGDSAGPSSVQWLNNGIKALKIPVVLPAAANLQIINAITINALTLQFSQQNPWAPAFSTDNTVANFQLPFAFPVNIIQTATDITAGDPNQANRKRAPGDFATLDVPLLPSTTDVVARTLLLVFSGIPFQSIDDPIFSRFLLDTTQGVTKTFTLTGAADTTTRTAIGDLSLTNIAFSVSTTILGLQGLNARPAFVTDLDVFRGFPSYLQINVNAHLYNPSNITIGTGDVSFALQFQGQIIGQAVISNLVLVPGENVVPTAVRYEPASGAPQQAGQLLLENFVQAIPSDTIIQGTDSTTPIASLQAALASIRLGTTIPPLEQNLVTQANLAFPLDIGTTGVADATINLGNPFTASINLVDVFAVATYNGLNLGNVNVQNLNPYITAPGKTLITSPTLPFALNTDPKVLIQFLLSAAQANGVDFGSDFLLPYLQYVLGLSSTDSQVTTSVNTQGESCAPTGTTARAQNLILAAVQNLRTDLQIQSVVRLDEYQTPLNFVQRQVPTILDRSVLYLTGIVGKTIVSRIVDQAQLSFSSGNVYNVTDNGFTVDLVGSLTNAGPFDAQIVFPQGVDVIWQGSRIANILLPPICSPGDTNVPDLRTTGILQITDLNRFTDFATFILLNPGFTWTITSNNLRVLALGTIFDNVLIQKDVSFLAFNGLPGVTISNPNFPSDSPNGIALVTDTLIPSPSNLGIQLGTATFLATFEGQPVGPVSANDLTLAPLATTSARLTGEIVRRRNSEDTAALGRLFSQFLQGATSTLQVVGQEVITPAQPDRPVNWLSTAFKQLTLNVALPGQRYTIIKSIDLLDLTVSILEDDQAYAVPTRNNYTSIVYANPFGFSLRAAQAGGSFTITYNGVNTASLQLPVEDVIYAGTSNGQDVGLVINFRDPRILQSLDTASFNAFFNAVTNTDLVGFNLNGGADVSAETNAGTIPITGIPFAVDTSLAGIQGLNARPTTVSNVVVNRGYPTYLEILADATLFNPSNITVITNDVVFGLEFMSQIIGSVLINDLLLIPDVNVIGTEVRYMPQGDAVAAGQALLRDFVEGRDIPVIISGTPNTTPYGSLQEALGNLRIATTIPALRQLLITQASLSFPLDIASNGGIANAQFDLSNPFNAAINLLGVIANATYESFFLGQINQPTLDPIISAPGRRNITSRTLPFTLTSDPKFLIQFLEAAAAERGVNLGILLPYFDYVLGLATTQTQVTSSVNTGRETCAPTGTTAQVQQLILASVANLRTNLSIASSLKLDEYPTNLDFDQFNVPTVLDESVLYLTGIIGATIVQKIVEDAQLSFSGGNVTNVTDNGFTVALAGSLVNAGPFDALITFPEGVDVIWQGINIANIILPDICSPGSTNVPDLRTTGILQITNLDGFTQFASFILLNPSFTWTVTTSKLRVFALQTIFDNVILSKDVSFLAFNKLSPGVTLSNPDFPSDAPNGINLEVLSQIPSPSNLGIELGDVSFIARYEGQIVGPVVGQDLTLPPMSVTTEPLTGVITYRDDAPGLTALGDLFSMFLMGRTSILQVQGNEVISPAQPNRPVNWLSAAFKTLTLDVALPGQVYEIISAITLKDLIVTILNPAQAYAPRVDNNETDVVYKNPFGFSLTAIQAGGSFTIVYNNANAGTLLLPKVDAISAERSNGQPADLVLAIQNAVLQADDIGAFNAFFVAITNTANVAFGLTGGANVTARTNAGDIPIYGIPFSVQTTFPGINGLGGVAEIPETPVVIGSGSGDPFAPTPGGDKFIRITLQTIVTNPAPLVLHTNFVAFQVLYRGVVVGRANINPLDLYQGSNTLATEFQYGPEDPYNEVAEDLLTQYLEVVTPIDIVVEGYAQSSPYGSLAAALDPISLKASFPGFGSANLIVDIQVFLDIIVAFCNNSAEFNFRINNRLQTSITVLSVSGTAAQSDTTYATFKQDLSPPLRAPGGISDFSSRVTLDLTQGVIKSLPLLINQGNTTGLDIDIFTSANVDNYNAPTLQYSQRHVAYTIIPSLGPLSLSPADLGSLLTNPLGSLENLFDELRTITTCTGLGGLSLLPGLPLSDLPILSLLPPILTGIIGGLGDGLSRLQSLLNPVSSIVSDVTSGVGSIISDITASGIVATLTSEIGNGVSDLTSDLGGVVSDATSFLGEILPRDVVRTQTVNAATMQRRAEAEATPRADKPTPTPTLPARVVPVAAEPTPTPAPAPAAAVLDGRSIDYGDWEAMARSPALAKLLKKHGWKLGPPIDQIPEEERFKIMVNPFEQAARYRNRML